MAISEGTSRAGANPGDVRAAEIIAGGLLCRGVQRDDPWTLDESIALFRRVRDAGGADFFTQLYLAEALRRRYPYSIFAIGEFERAEGMLDSGRQLAEPERFRRHIRRAKASIRDTVSRTASSLRRIDERSTDVSAAPEDMADGLVILATTGEAGYRSALRALDRMIASGADENGMLATFYRAEVMRGYADKDEVWRLYAAAQSLVCEGGAAENPQLCSRVEGRLRWRRSIGSDTADAKGGKQ